MRKFIVLCTVLLIFCFVGSANADLFVRGTDSLGNQLIYDDDLDITWYDYTRSFYGWPSQVAWADALSISFNGGTIDDWRLPTTPGTAGVAVYTNEGEMGHLFYDELGLVSGENYQPEDLNATEFDNLDTEWYWTSTEYGESGNKAYIYSLYAGAQNESTKDNTLSAIAVRDGDVPVPGGMYLLCSGLIGLASLSRWKRHAGVTPGFTPGFTPGSGHNNHQK